ncbi:MAG: recombination protein RecR [Oscillospiraceae bacterium]|nr:recombination protein RecR [Oscillospiraceae bacterium]MBQ4000655.1 recombination protein RecR [Oscillospiraceae bacterium]MBQ4239568.1 recombination protein RecR [Oscillospiraceae bacterium]
MANTIPTLDRLIDCFAALPGVGRKSASRFAYHILDIPEEQAMEFSQAIAEARQNVHQCPICHNLTDTEECSICSDANRDRSMICVVESPRDVSSIEKTREYKGLYHVLHGLISPLDGIGPEQLFIKQLITRAADDSVKEVIMATNPTVEGESTAMYISKLIKPLGVRVTRLATGVPVGGNLEYADEMTLFKALEGRSEI